MQSAFLLSTSQSKCPPAIFALCLVVALSCPPQADGLLSLTSYEVNNVVVGMHVAGFDRILGGGPQLLPSNVRIIANGIASEKANFDLFTTVAEAVDKCDRKTDKLNWIALSKLELSPAELKSILPLLEQPRVQGLDLILVDCIIDADVLLRILTIRGVKLHLYQCNSRREQ